MMTEDDLDGLFAAASATNLRPSTALTARVLADADAALGPANAQMSHPKYNRPNLRPNLWTALAGFFGGGGAMAGMVTATVAGFYIGFAQPMDTSLVTSVLGGDMADIDMMPGIDALLDEAP